MPPARLDRDAPSILARRQLQRAVPVQLGGRGVGRDSERVRGLDVDPETTSRSTSEVARNASPSTRTRPCLSPRSRPRGDRRPRSGAGSASRCVTRRDRRGRRARRPCRPPAEDQGEVALRDREGHAEEEVRAVEPRGLHGEAVRDPRQVAAEGHTGERRRLRDDDAVLAHLVLVGLPVDPSSQVARSPVVSSRQSAARSLPGRASTSCPLPGVTSGARAPSSPSSAPRDAQQLPRRGARRRGPTARGHRDAAPPRQRRLRRTGATLVRKEWRPRPPEHAGGSPDPREENCS